jgi:signal peptidase I
VKFDSAIYQTRPVTNQAARLAALLALTGWAVLLTGCASLSVRQDLDTIVAMAPAPVLVTKGQELRTAEAAAAQMDGAEAFRGVGDSMEPIYASGTAIVVMPCDYRQLQPGMSVVYVNQDGRGVAHALVQQTNDGWVAQGVNNPERDRDLVTARNLVGIITQAYASSDTPLRREIAGRAALKAANAAKTRVALNLSKVNPTGMVVAWQ